MRLVRFLEKSGHQVTHPHWEGIETTAKIVANRFSLLWVIQDFPNPLENCIAINWKHVVKPVKRLHDPHRRPARPVEPAWSGQLEIDHESVEVNGTEPGVGVDRDFGRHGVGEAKLVGRRDSIGKKAGLLPPCNGVDDCCVVGTIQFAGQRVDARNIVEPALDAPDIA